MLERGRLRRPGDSADFQALVELEREGAEIDFDTLSRKTEGDEFAREDDADGADELFAARFK